VRRGEVRWGTPTLSGGARKKRAFVVVSDDAFNLNERYTKVMVVNLTSIRRPGGPFDWEVEVPKGVARLQKSSVIKCAEVYTLLKAHIGDLVGTLPHAYLEKVDVALTIALGLPSNLRPSV
jgi:mRNA-degrading endonuclease toxin of MazEF toxin-antitoxin module